MKQGWITGLKNIADYCGIHIDTLKRWMKCYVMPIIKIQGRWCADPSALDEWLNYPLKKAESKIPP